jgi:hypothetical protein
VLFRTLASVGREILFYSFGGALAGATGNVYGFERWQFRYVIKL